MSLKPSVSVDRPKILVYGLSVSLFVLLVTLGIFASSAWSPEAGFAVAGSGLGTIKAETTPVPLPSPALTPIVASNATASPSPSPTPPRILSQFENAGTITVSGNGSVREAALARARSFLVRKWTDRQRGRMVLTIPRLGAYEEQRSFYVEPDSEGAWRVTLEIPNEEPAQFYVVEEIGVDAQGQPILSPSPGAPQAVARALHLKQNANSKFGMVF